MDELENTDGIDEILADEEMNKGNLEAALELARLVAAETGICCERLGAFAWLCFRRLEGMQ